MDHGCYMAWHCYGVFCRKDSIAVYIHSIHRGWGVWGNMDMSRYYESNDESTSADHQLFSLCYRGVYVISRQHMSSKP